MLRVKSRFLLILSIAVLFASCAKQQPRGFNFVSTVAGANGELAEPFGIAVKGADIYVSDGEKGKLLKIAFDGAVSDFAVGLETPSAIAFTKAGDLIVA